LPSFSSCYAQGVRLLQPRGSGKKLSVYAQQRVPEYWIVNLVDDCIEIRTEPHDLGFASVATLWRGESVAFLAFPGEPLLVDDILPPQKSA
jgi:Uma2 family endonuclease